MNFFDMLKIYLSLTPGVSFDNFQADSLLLKSSKAL